MGGCVAEACGGEALDEDRGGAAGDDVGSRRRACAEDGIADARGGDAADADGGLTRDDAAAAVWGRRGERTRLCVAESCGGGSHGESLHQPAFDLGNPAVTRAAPDEAELGLGEHAVLPVAVERAALLLVDAGALEDEGLVEPGADEVDAEATVSLDVPAGWWRRGGRRVPAERKALSGQRAGRDGEAALEGGTGRRRRDRMLRRREGQGASGRRRGDLAGNARRSAPFTAS